MIDTCVDALQTLLSASEKTGSNIGALTSTVRAIVTLLGKLSSFWTSEGLAKVVSICIRYERSSDVDKLGKAVVKNISPDVCLPTLVDTWEISLGSNETVS